MDAGGPRLGKEFDGRGKDLNGAIVLVGELVAGVRGSELGNRTAAIGGGAARETA